MLSGVAFWGLAVVAVYGSSFGAMILTFHLFARVSAIHFYDQYIVIEKEGHGGQVIPVRQIKHFRWD